MPDYIASVRKLRRGVFGAGYVSTQFLRVPSIRNPVPDHSIIR